MWKRQIPAVISLLAALSGAACSGTVNLDVSDAPVDTAKQVVVQFSGVSFTPVGGNASTHTFNPPLTLDLRALDGGQSASLLSGLKLTDGNYSGLTLMVNATGNTAAPKTDSYVVLSDDSVAPLLMTDSSGLSINSSYHVPKDETRNLVIDFNLRASLRNPLTGATAYGLVPTLRLVDRDNSGSIVGNFSSTGASALAADSSRHCAVYAYAGANAVVGDQGSSNPPLTSARVSGTSPYAYQLAFLPPGAYTVAYTCDADKDDPAVPADVTPTLQNGNVSVSAGTTTTLDF